MKKTLFSALAVVLFAAIISCQSNQKETTEGDTTQVVVNKDTTIVKQSTSVSAPSADAKVEAPKFSSEEVNEGFAKFEPLKQEYIDAIKSKDAAKIKAVNEKYIEWVKVAANWGSKLTKEESKIHTDYYVKLVSQWDLITPKTKK